MSSSLFNVIFMDFEHIIGMFIRYDNFEVNLTTIPQIPSP